MKLLPLFLTAALLPLTLSAGEPSPPPMPPAPPSPGMPPMPPVPPMPEPAAPSMHVMYDAAQLKWGDPPPALERGAKVAVLSGDPKSPGLFVIRLKAPAGFKVARHWHPTDEHVTVIEGELTLSMDHGAAGENAHTFGAGGYALLPARMHHTATTKNGVIVQVSGMGPFEVNYVDPKDDPRLRSAAR